MRAGNHADVPALGLFETVAGHCDLRLGHPVVITERACDLMEEGWPLLDCVTDAGLMAIARAKAARRKPFEWAAAAPSEIPAHGWLVLEMPASVLPGLHAGIGVVTPARLRATGLRTATVPHWIRLSSAPYRLDFTQLCDPVMTPIVVREKAAINRTTGGRLT